MDMSKGGLSGWERAIMCHAMYRNDSWDSLNPGPQNSHGVWNILQWFWWHHARSIEAVAEERSFRVTKAATGPGEVIPHQKGRVKTWTTCQTKKRPICLDPLKSEPAQEQKNDPAQWNTSSEIVLSTSDKKLARNKISKFRSKLKKLENSIRSALVDPVLYEILKDTAGEQLQSLLNSIKLKVNESTPWQKHLIAEIKSSAEYNEDSSVYEAALD